MDIDRPEVITEVAAAFAAYEEALVANDVDRIIGFFAGDAIRFGLADQQTGLAEQERWRRAQPPLPPGRHLEDTTIRGYGPDVAIVTTLFGYPGRDVLGRQSQTWARRPEGWRIVHAHVSEPGTNGPTPPP